MVWFGCWQGSDIKGYEKHDEDDDEADEESYAVTTSGKTI